MKSLIKLALAAAVLLSVPPLQAIENSGLAGVHDDVRQKYQTVKQLSPAGFQALDPERLLILDVREPAEFSVSRLAGAHLVSPAIDTKDFLAQFASMASDRHVVVYCSVGHRSSKLAALVQQALIRAGASSVQNLAGGIFNWHNEKRPLVNAQGATEFVHPYSWWWGRHVERSDLRRYKFK